MAEVITEPMIDAEGNATFPESCTVSDIVRYAIKCSDLETVQWIANTWKEYNPE